GVAQVLEPALVGRAGGWIEQLAGVARRRTAAALPDLVPPACEVEYVELATGVAEQGLQEGEPLRVLQLEAVTPVDDGPQLDVMAQHGLYARTGLRGVASLVRRGFSVRGVRQLHQPGAQARHAASLGKLESRGAQRRGPLPVARRGACEKQARVVVLRQGERGTGAEPRVRDERRLEVPC